MPAPPATEAPAPAPASAPATPNHAAPAEVDTSDPTAVWQAVLEKLAANRALAWVRMLQLDRLEGGQAVLTPLPGRREVVKFAQPRQLAPVAAALNEVLGRRVELSVEAPGPAAATPADQAATAARKEALDLPLVRRILEVFPDANLLSVEDEESQETDASENSESADDEDETP